MNRYDQSRADYQARGDGDIPFIGVAAVMAILLGILHVVSGITGLMNEGLYIMGRISPFGIDGVTWSWVQLVEGVVLIVAGAALFTEKAWARVLGMVVGGAGVLINLAHLPDYPIWSIWMLALSAGVVVALIAQAREQKLRSQPQPHT